MMTPTHLLIAGAILTRKDMWKLNLSVVTGALLPDFSIYFLFVWARVIKGISEQTLWAEVYWQQPWQTLSAISNSIPLYVALLVAGLAFRAKWLSLLAIAALLHIAFDLPFHHADAHQHFWPISEMRFHSPLSYWNPTHYGDYVSLVEMLLAVICVSFIWRRFRALWLRTVLALGFLSYIAVPLYFHLMLG